MSQTSHDTTAIERLARRERHVLLGSLFGVTLLCWLWILPMARDMYGPMTGASGWMMTLRWDLQHVLLLFAMWTVMMAGMMLPSAAPMLLLYAVSARRADDPAAARRRVHAMAAGYLLAWTLFSAVATAAQRLLTSWLVMTPMMQMGPIASGTVLLVAGVYQLTPLKRACLTTCRSPLTMLTRGWKSGPRGALQMGFEHGLYCVGCCWALMLLLFAGGVMNLYVITALTVLVLVEKLAPFGARTSHATGAVLIAAGVWVLTRTSL